MVTTFIIDLIFITIKRLVVDKVYVCPFILPILFHTPIPFSGCTTKEISNVFILILFAINGMFMTFDPSIVSLIKTY